MNRAPQAAITVPSSQLQRTSTMHRAPPATITVPSSQQLQGTSTVHRAPSLPSRSLHPSFSALPPCTELHHCHHGPFISATAHFHCAPSSFCYHHGPFILTPAHFHRAPSSASCHHGPIIPATAHIHRAPCSSSYHHGPFIPAPAHFHRAPCSFTAITVPSSQLQRTSTVHRAPSATITVPSS